MQPLNYTPINSVSQGDVQGYKDQYAQSQGAYNQAQQTQQDYTKNMQSGTDMYNQAFGTASQNAAYDPARLAQAQQQVQNLQGQIGGLPRTIQAQNANYGATAADINSQTMAAQQIYGQGLGQANTAASNQLQDLSAALTGAQQSTTAGLQGQQQKQQGFQAATANALSQMDEAQKTMSFFEQLLQTQGSLNATQLADYNTARNGYMTAQAAMQSAQAATTTANANAAAIRQEIAGRAALGGSFGYGNAPATPAVAKPITAPPPAAGSSIGSLFNRGVGNVGNFINKIPAPVVQGVKTAGNALMGPIGNAASMFGL